MILMICPDCKKEYEFVLIPENDIYCECGYNFKNTEFYKDLGECMSR